jgi:hypothetical protein
MLEKTIVHHVDSWPIVVSTIHGKEHTEATLDQAYAAWTGFMHKGPHVLILDMTDGTAGASAAQRARVAAWIERNETLLRARKQLAHVLVFDSAIMRGIVTAVFWLRPPANPHYTAQNLDHAVDIAVEVLRQAGITVAAERVAAARRVSARPGGRSRGAATTRS